VVAVSSYVFLQFRSAWSITCSANRLMRSPSSYSNALFCPFRDAFVLRCSGSRHFPKSFLCTVWSFSKTTPPSPPSPPEALPMWHLSSHFLSPAPGHLPQTCPHLRPIFSQSEFLCPPIIRDRFSDRRSGRILRGPEALVTFSPTIRPLWFCTRTPSHQCTLQYCFPFV